MKKINSWLIRVYNSVIYHLYRAIELGAEPIVDWCHYPNDYLLENGMIGKLNAWEEFFEQISDVSLEEVYHCKNVIMSSGDTASDLGEVYDLNQIIKSHEIIEKYIRHNKTVKKEFDKEYEKLSMKKHTVLGVKCRGTDFTETKPKGHSICPDAKQTIELGQSDKIKRMKEYLISVYLLARCDALIAPVVGAMRIKGKYDDLYLFQLGNYE